jgi:hypothetical protein
MVDDKPDETGPQPDLDRPKRAAPTLDLDAIEISDETRQADAANAEDKPGRARSWPLAAVMSSAIVSAIFGAGAAALVVWLAGWPGETPPAAPPPQASSAAIDALTARVASVELKAATPAAAPQINNAALDALAARLASVEATAAAPPRAPAAPAAPDPAIAAQVGTLEKSVAALRDELAATRAESEKTAAAVNEVKSAPRETPAPPPPPDLSAINARLARIEAAANTLSAEAAQRNAAPKDDPQLRRVVAAALLDTSVRTGEPYAAALSAAKPFAASPDALKPLEVFAATGVPGANTLNRELAALLPKLSPAQETSTTGSGIVDRLQAGAARLVRIERTEAVPGNDRSAIVSRVTAAALRNDIAEARRELKTLAPADRAAAQSWIDKADARDAALAASRQFAADAMGAFTKPAQ